ncbi:MAG: hypothetical protein R3Y29_02385 [bacterium]
MQRNNKIKNICKEVFFIDEKSGIIYSKEELDKGLRNGLIDVGKSEEVVVKEYARYVDCKIKK